MKDIMEQLAVGLNKSAIQYQQKNKTPIEELLIEERKDEDSTIPNISEDIEIVHSQEDIDRMMIEAFFPDVKWETMNRDQKRRAKAYIKKYKNKWVLNKYNNIKSLLQESTT